LYFSDMQWGDVMKLWRFIVPLILALSITVPVAASDVSSAVYTGDIVVTNSAGSTQAGSVAFTLNTDNLLSAGYIAPDFSNVAVQNPTLTDAAFMPARSGSDQWLIYVPSILSAQTYRLYTGGMDNMGAKLYYFPGDRGMTTPDSASLELGNNFDIEWAGMITADTTGLLVGKGLAFACTVSNGNANAAIIDTARTEIAYTESGQDLYSGSVTGYGTRFNNVPAGRALVQSIWCLKKTGSPTGTIYFNARVGASPYNLIGTIGTIDASSLTDSYLWIDVFGHVVNPATQHVLYTVEYAGGNSDNKISVGTTGGSTNGYRLTTSWGSGNPTPMYKIGESSIYVSTPVPAGDRAIHVSADTSTLSISYDDNPAVSVSTGGASVTNNSELWRASAGMPYMDYLKITVGGVLRQHIAWENAATFTDLSGNNNHATPTFRTTTSDPDLSAEFRNYRPVAVAAPIISGSDTPSLITSTPVAPASMYTENDYDNIPGAAALNALLDNADIPREIIWYPGIFLLAIAAGFIIYLLTRSLIALSVAMTLVIVVFTFLGPLPFWLIIPFALFCFATILKRENPGGM
jgi:hypothetical protein